MKHLTILLLVAALSGCAGAGFLGHAAGGGTKKVQVQARYRGLEGRSVAVLVAANEYLLYQHPDADQSICTAVTNRLAANLPSITLMPPRQVMSFQEKNPYWTAMPYDELIARLGVERVVMIDLSEYQTHEPGNAHVWQGVISADVGVIEAETAASNRLAFLQTVTARFPENSQVGMLNTNDAEIQTGMLAFFSRDAAGLFYDHQIEVKK